MDKIPYKKGPGISRRQYNTLFKRFCGDKLIAYSKYGDCAAKDARVNRNTAEHYFRLWREAIYRHLRKAPRFFGEVEVDQKGFGGHGRKKLKQALKQLAKTLPESEYREQAKLLRTVHKTQVMAILQRGGDIYVHIIKNGEKRTLMPIIRLVIEQGSTIYTDKWRAFSELGIDGYRHTSINHSITYSDRKGGYINNVESFFSFAERRLAKFNGLPEHTTLLHLKECEFRWNHREDFAKALKRILKNEELPPKRKPSVIKTTVPRANSVLQTKPPFTKIPVHPIAVRRAVKRRVRISVMAKRRVPIATKRL